jgi:hypothetical protein
MANTTITAPTTTAPKPVFLCEPNIGAVLFALVAFAL